MNNHVNQQTYNPTTKYFIADPSFWPIVGAIGLFTTVIGLVQLLHGGGVGSLALFAGLGILIVTMVGWFSRVIHESLQGMHSAQMDRTYRWGMFWFIVSELFLFGIFFGALFYVRVFGLTELGNTVGSIGQALLLSKGPFAHELLWPNFHATWPLLVNPNPQLFPGPKGVIDTWRIPAINTIILLSSAVTVTWAHWGLKKANRKQLIIGLAITILLGCIFEACQVYEYTEAYTKLHLTPASGIYGSTFFTLTGLHAMHVSMGVIMLTIILIRSIKNHFLPEHHFAFEAVSWYWHFVDVVWLFLFIFVYWL